MPDDRKETPYQHSQNGLLISGMTTHYPSDVFLFYPPDSIGGRPSEYTILQNVSPTHRDSQESFRALQQQQRRNRRSNRAANPANRCPAREFQEMEHAANTSPLNNPFAVPFRKFRTQRRRSI
ncbi:hypothetical protein AJ80_00603 [Polytolypa hystricis UAMH7299]|uniref:Uncharacterized protein n=1 Tax=Polytolypa hystricis (strain UAMH7299) TaxID=1447883 RepID=A0A2B7Z2H5_POLH7|nr:hypothetical protein AJ80_00603 [Polytolypa hystricis UAMH7299]